MGHILACLSFHFSWADWGPLERTWPVLAALVMCVAAHAWLLLEATRRRNRFLALQVLASGGCWTEILQQPRPRIRVEALSALSLGTIPLGVWASCRLAAMYPSRVDEWHSDEWWRALDSMWTRIGALNACAIWVPLVGAIIALSWATAIAWLLRIHGIRHAAGIALDADATPFTSTYRSPPQRHGEIAAWLLHPGPEPRWLQAACLSFVVTVALPMGAGVHWSLASLVEHRHHFVWNPLIENGRDCAWNDEACIESELAHGRRTLTLASWTAFAGGTASIVALLAVLAAPRRRRRRLTPSPGPPATPSLLACGACLAGAAILTLAVEPYAAENRAPLRLGLGITTLRPPVAKWISLAPLDGPDKMADVVWVDLPGQTFVADRISWTTLEVPAKILKARRELWEQVASEPFPGVVTLSCDSKTTFHEVVEMAGVARAAGWSALSMVVTRPERQTRPLLGELVLYHQSAVHIALSDGEPAEGAETLQASAFDTCEEFVRAAAEIRRSGRGVRLVPWPPTIP